MYIDEIEPFLPIHLCFISQACYLPKYIVSYCEGHQTYFKSLNSNESSEAQKSNLTQFCVFKHVYGNTGNKGYFNYCLLSVKLGYFWSICRIFSQPKQGEFRLSPEKMFTGVLIQRINIKLHCFKIYANDFLLILDRYLILNLVYTGILTIVKIW